MKDAGHILRVYPTPPPSPVPQFKPRVRKLFMLDMCLIPSFIAKMVTSTDLKFCNSRACPWLVRVSKFPMAALENKKIWLRPRFFAFAFKHSTFRSREVKQPSSHVLTWRLGQNSPPRPQIRKPGAPGRNVWH